jgi:hypothetical protein
MTGCISCLLVTSNFLYDSTLRFIAEAVHVQAFLQRIITSTSSVRRNGGGHLNREYGLGRKPTDLFIEWPVSEEDG